MTKPIFMDGTCDPAFKGVRDALTENLTDTEEIGEWVLVVINGKTVVDLWGGYEDKDCFAALLRNKIVPFSPHPIF